MDIGAWLRELGLERYEEAFRENEIDARSLPHLTGDDLKELGVAAIGHRRRLLEAIANLSAGGARPENTADRPVHDTASMPPSAERRQLTVMFVDLVGSTELAARLDPEDLGAVMRAYHRAVAGEIARFEGHVAKYLGDGVLGYFGWPKAHEDEAERAVRAGLAITESVAGLTTPLGAPLVARIGIATGPVVVGELIGEGAAQEQAVVGETPNLAARLQALADQGSVVVASGTRRLLGGLFELEDLGPQPLKGFFAPLRAWRVVAESRIESRFEALHGRQLAPPVGREHELKLLLDRWERATAGEGQVVLLSGEPGIGKSRLLRALREQLAGQTYMPLGHDCSPYHTSSALHPVIGLLERAAGFERDDPPEARLAKLEALLALGSDRLDEGMPLVAALLDVPVGEQYSALSLTPQRQKQRTLEVLVDQVAGLAARQPVLALYEDAHWMDPTTLELLGLVIERMRQLPVLVLITFRPEFSPPWTGHAHVTQLSLARLTRRHGAEIALRVTGGKPLPEAVLEQIVATTDGVPLFVEELTKTVLESGLLRDAGDRWELVGALPPLAIPDSLHDSLMARLDRLGPVKEIAQTAAVIGRDFSHGLLAAVAPLPEAKLSAALDELVRAELIFRRGLPPDATYTFKHALVRDAAYESLLKSRRRGVHARVVAALEARSADMAAAEPEVLAHHCAQAGLLREAVDYRYRAGQQAIAQSAMAEAVVQLRRGLEVLQELPDGPERQQRELGLQVALGRALIPAKGFAAPDTGRAYIRARELCVQLGDTPQLFPILYGQYVFHFERAELDAAHQVAWELLRLAQERGDAAAQVAGHRIVGSVTFQLGRLPVARTHLEQGLALYDAVRDRSSGFVYAIDSRVICSTWLSHALFALGFPEQAQAHSTEALGYARELAHPPSLTLALGRACSFHRFSRDAAAVRQLAEARIALAAERGFPQDLAAGEFDRSWALLTIGQAEGCIARVQGAMAAYRATGAERGAPADLADLAEAHNKAAQPAKARALLDDALGRVERTGERWYEAELHRRRGKLLLSLAEPDRGEAAACFRRALEIAGEQQAKMWELRAATSLARLWAEQGKRQKALDLLAPVYGWFTEGFDTANLKDARALLDELS